jgi:DNA-binding FadR family transcriptional regulator
MTPETLQKLRNWLDVNGLTSGARLPAERTMAASLDVSRSELRKALMLLELDGQITRHVGRGTFVAEMASASRQNPDLGALAARTAPHEAMMARLTLEPELAHLAALHATPLQIGAARALAEEMQGAADWTDYERLDHAFHDLLAECAGNPLLHELYKIMNAVRQVVVWRKLSPDSARPPADYHSFAEHETIVAALENRDRGAAKRAMRAHLTSTMTAMTHDE